MKKIIILAKDSKIFSTMEKAVTEKGLEAIKASESGPVLDSLKNEGIAAVFVETGTPGTPGEELLKQTRSVNPDCPVILLSHDDSSKAALKASRAGAYDFLPLPLEDGDLAECLDRLSDRLGNNSNSPEERFGRIIGQSKAIKNVFRLVDKVAKTDSTVMIYGESGTGKELIAQAIHHNSHRCACPLIPVNCGAIPEELLESELFGHEKGAFTSAIRTRIGRFEMANGGSIFLDEIADMSPKLQVKILRVLQEHQFERVGGQKTIDVDIRVITASNKNLRQAMEEGRFREDLFYRLNVIPITVPPLRERKTDVPLLIDFFMKRFREKRGQHIKGIEPGAMEKLLHYSWPGNIRELENIIERMVILAEGDHLTIEDLPSRISEVVPAPPGNQYLEIGDDGLDFNQVVSDFEDNLLLQALEKSGWVKNKAALLLKLNRTTLVEKLKKKGIVPPAG
ncbi:MAG: sigma-54 dependent transcriptional regulator [Pseudomonadota bacterium]